MTNKHAFPDTHHDVSSNTIFGFWLYLMTDCVMFATFFAVYAVLQGGTYGGPTGHDIFSIPYALKETLVLLASSFACSMAMLQAPKKSKNNILAWFGLTFVLGIVFMGMGISEFKHLIAEGITWEKSAFLTSYFTLIGTHSLHIVVGLILMIVFGVQLLMWGLTPMVLRRLTCLRIYWNFLYLIWIFTFTLVYLTGAK